MLFLLIGFNAANLLRQELVSSAQKKIEKTSSYKEAQTFFTIQFMKICSASLFLLVMKSFISTFSCDYSLEPFLLYADNTIICNSNYHQTFMILAVFGILFYYPLSSFFIPNIQFLDKKLDLKYETTWISLLAQVKLIATGYSNILIKVLQVSFQLGMELQYSWLRLLHFFS